MGNLLGGPNRRLSLSFQVDFSFFKPIQKCDYRRGVFFVVVLVVVSFLFFPLSTRAFLAGAALAFYMLS